MKNILFICTGNTCRSPMAEAIAAKVINDSGLNFEYTSSSAGISTIEDQKASYQAVEAMKEYDLDIESHRTRQLNAGMVKSAYIIFTMTVSQKKYVASMYPELSNKMFSIKGYVDRVDGDIDDPYGRSVAEYKSCANELYKYIVKAIKKLSLQNK